MTELILSDQLKQQFKEQFLIPANLLFSKGIVPNPNSNGAYNPEAIAIKSDQRNTIIDFGRGEFQSATDGLTPAQKVDLYCFYYFQMHFSSSYVFYNHEKEFLLKSITNKKVIFIDLGCGPFTAGLAFNRWLTNFANDTLTDVNYIGIDTSKEMLHKAEQVSKSATTLRYKSITFSDDKNKFLSLALPPTKDKEILVILNFSYLFASNSLTIPSIVAFTNEINQYYSKLASTNLIILQQNPDYAALNQKWGNYKSQLPFLISKSGYPQLIEFTFDDFLGSFNYPTLTLTVRCDVLKSL